MNQEMTNRVVELLGIALRDLKEVDDDPYVEDAKGSIYEVLAIVNGEFSSFDNQF